MQSGDVVAERFELEREAASGGMGVVFRAHDRLRGEPVALKVLQRADPDLIARFAREARVLAELDHPGIVRYAAHGVTSEGRPWLAMEWLEGEDLSDRLASRPLDMRECLELAIRIADALGSAHARNVVHRDLKPSNLFLPQGEVSRAKLLDFGIARLGLQETRARTAAGTVLGTPGYMAPEQARGDQVIDARADVFALGCVIFECVCGRPAFQGEHPMALLAKILLEEAPRMSSVRSEVPPALDDLVRRMMAKDRERRPRDGHAVAEELRAIVPFDSSGMPPPLSMKPLSLGSGEQRIVSVLLVGGTARTDAAAFAETLSIADARRALSEPVRVILDSFGAQADVLIDGTIVASLQGTGSAIDRASQAATCALSLRGVVPDSTIVLATGRGVIAERTPIGEVIERAVVLLRAPQDTTIRIDEVTAGLLDARFDVRDEAHGFGLYGVRDRLEEAGRTLLGKPTPFVGRDRELSFVLAAFDECASEPVARVVIVTAPTGAGKSRLRYEVVRALRARTPSPLVVLGRGDAMRAGSPFGILARAIRSSAGVLDDEAPESRRRKLQARIGRHVKEKEVARVTEFVGEIVGVDFPAEPRPQLRAARGDAMLMADQMRRAFEDYLQAECEVQPVVLVLDDLQWGDLPSVQLVDAALRHLRDRPLMVLALGRPEMHDGFPKLWAERDPQEVRLGPLTRKSAERLARDVLPDLADDRVARLVERAAGNALYLEELIRAEASGHGDEMPQTMLAMMEARLVALDPEARRVLRAASVFGETFWRTGVASLLGGDAQLVDVAAWLSILIERELVVERDHSRFTGEQELAFRHALVHDAAYAMLTEEDRVLGHRLAGEWLEQRGDADALALAEHFERGGVSARAAHWYARAADDALQGSDLAGAIARADRAIACGAQGEARGALRLIQAEAHRWRGEVPEAVRASSDALSLLQPGSPKWCVTAGEAALAEGQVGNTEGLLRLGDILMTTAPAADALEPFLVAAARATMQLAFLGQSARAEQLTGRVDEIEAKLGDAMGGATHGRIDQLRGYQANISGDLAAGLRFVERALATYDALGDVRAASAQRANLGDTLKELGQYERAERVLREALADSERLGIHRVTAHVHQDLALVVGALGRRDEALVLARRAVDMAAQHKAQRLQGVSRIYLARILLANGDPSGADREARTALTIPSLSGGFRAVALATLAEAALAGGHANESARLAREAVEAAGNEPMEEGESILRLAVAEASHATGDHDGARRAIELARTRLLARAEKLDDAELRRSLLERIPENARILALAESWLEAP